MPESLAAVEAYTEIKSHAESIRNDDAHTIETMSPGDAWAQGDVLVQCVGSLPRGCTEVDCVELQVAPGTTQGSRHVWDSSTGVKMFRLPAPTALDGPVYVLSECRTLTHPEHGDVTVPPGIYRIRYQRAYADELQRVRD